jgi:hypothetical protein
LDHVEREAGIDQRHDGVVALGAVTPSPPGVKSSVSHTSAVPGPTSSRHRLTGQARTDDSPEGIAVSPDGRFVVTENLVRSWKPWNDPLLSPGGSINLLEFDKRSGRLTTRQHLPLNGILPEGITVSERRRWSGPGSGSRRGPA